MQDERETEFGTFDRPCNDYDPGRVVDGVQVNPNVNCVYCGFEKTWHLEYATGCGAQEVDDAE